MQATDPARLRLGLRFQITLGLGALGALLAAVIVANLLNLAHIQQIASQAVEVEGQLNRLANDVVIYTQLCRRYEKEAFLNVGDPSARDFYLLLWQGAYENLDSAIESFGRAATSAEDRRQAEEWRAQSARYREAFLQTKQAITHGGITRPQDANAALNPFKDDIQALTDTALTMAQLKAVKAQQAQSDLLESTAADTRTALLIGGVALAIALAWIALFPSYLMRPIQTLRSAVARLAAGDLAARVGLRRADELGALARGFDEMAETIEQRTGDIVAQHRQAEAARLEAESARSAIAAQLETIARQQAVIREMSVPILPLTDSTLVMPLVGALDSERLRLIHEQAIEAIEQSAARHLILDITGVPIVDTHVAQELIRVVQAARLLGAEVVLVGIRPEVAQAVVGLGLRLDAIATRGTLQGGVSYVLRQER